MRASLQRRFVLALACTGLALSLAPRTAAQTWTHQYPTTFPDLLDVATDGAGVVLAVGNDGVVLRSVDAGLTWMRHGAPTGRLAAVEWIGGIVLAGGDGLFRSDDGGVTFAPTHPIPGVQAIEAVGLSDAWAVTDTGYVLRSQDAGASWSLTTLPAGWFGAAHAVTFESPTHGWIVGQSGQFLRTTDGGSTWLATPSPTNWTLFGAQRDATSVKFLLEDSGTYRGVVNGWTYSLFPWVTNARDFHIVGDFGVVVGLSGRIMVSPNNGVNWIFAYDDGPREHEGVVILDPLVAVVVGEDGRVLRTDDGGSNWIVVHGAGATSSPWIRGLSATDSDTLFAACTSGKVLRTDDAGAHWVELQAGTASTHLVGVSSFDGVNVYAVGKRQGFYPTFCYSHDGGLNWNELNQLGMYDIWDVEALGANEAVAASDTRIWRTSNGGVTWTSTTPTPYADFHDVDFVSATTGWAAGTAIFRTDDGGVTWTFQHDAAQRMWGASFFNSNAGWAVGEAGAILRTVDGGVNWTPQASGTSETLTAVHAISASVAFAVGAGGSVLYTSNGGASWLPNAPLGLSNDPLNGVVATTQGVWIGGDLDAGIWRLWNPLASCVAGPYCTAKVHSLGGIAEMTALGFPSVALQTVGIGVIGGIPNTVGLGFRSLVGPAALPLWNGTLCVQAPLARMPILSFDNNGFASYLVPMVPAMVGDSHWYQVIFRDVNAVDGTNLGLTNGLWLTFCP